MQRFYYVTHGGITNHVMCGFHDVVCISDDIRLNLTVELLLHWKEISSNQPWSNWRHCPRIRHEGQKCRGRAHLGHLASSAAFEGGTFRIRSRIITDSKRRFEVSDFLELVEEDWWGIRTLNCPVQTCQKAGCVTGRLRTRWWTQRTLTLPDIGPQLSGL
jgi:hypothetical protein